MNDDSWTQLNIFSIFWGFDGSDASGGDT